MFGRYEILEPIGRGGFGSVYRASDPAHGREVAIKVLHGKLGDTERRRFDRERRAMGRLGSHPNIVPVYDSGYTDAGEAYLVMELASGGSLQNRLDAAGPLPWSEAAGIMAGIASAVEAAHLAGVLHRDVKPDNILIDEYGNAKLTDFGIASVADSSTATTSTSATIAHAAPEVLDGSPSTAAVDIYAIGSTLHNLIAGTAPFYREGDATVAAMIGRIATQPPPDLRPLGVPDPVAAVVERALAKAPDHRQAAAAQVAEELRAAMGHGGVPATSGEAAPVSPPPTVPVPRPPHAATAPPLSEDQPTVVQQPPPQRSRAFDASDRPPAVDRRGEPLARWALIAILVVAIIGLAAVLALRGDDQNSDPIASESTDGVSATASSETPTTTTVADGSTVTPTTSPDLTAETAAETTAATTPVVERDLTFAASATASSSSDAGNDACGARTTFGAANVLDGRAETAWRTGGDGVGERIDVNLDGTKSITLVGLIPGYAKTDRCDGADRFVENRRIETVRWHVGAETIVQRFDPNDPSLQTIRLDQPIETDTVVLEIEATTAHGGRDFTAVSEVRILGG